MAEPVFSIDKVSYSYQEGINALSGITLTINKGERAAFIGANGTGKSTLLAMLDALIFPSVGSLTALGEVITERSMNSAPLQKKFRSRVGFVFQNPDVQLFCPTVREDIAFGPLQTGVVQDEIKKRIEEVAGQLRITHLLDRSPHSLSLGEKKKAAIAGVLVMQPEVLLLDEPTAGLDPQTTRDIIHLLVHAHEEGRTVVFATHDLHIVEEIADVVHVFGGNHTIIRSGKPEEILTDKDFLQKNNLVHVHVHRHLHTHHAHPH